MIKFKYTGMILGVKMVCEHLKKLYSYIKESNIEVSSSDLISFVCKKCHIKDQCSGYMPAEFYEKYK